MKYTIIRTNEDRGIKIEICHGDDENVMRAIMDIIREATRVTGVNYQLRNNSVKPDKDLVG
jgi:hypothetical protein